jgi:hypothetical protein
MSKASKSFIETTLEDLGKNPLKLLVAALLFAAGLSLAAPSSYSVSALPPFLGLNNLVLQFLAGLMALAGFLLAFLKGQLGLSTIFTEAKALVTGAALWTIGMFFIGIGNSQGFTPLGVIASLIGYALLLVSLVLTGQLAVSVSTG